MYDFLKNNLPTCFAKYFKLVNEIHSIGTKSSEIGCLYVPHFSTKNYGLNSITKKSIDSWNYFTKTFNCKLKNYSRSALKNKITSHFLDTY